MHIDIALVAYLIDWIVGEFRFVRHPVVVIGDAIGWFERRFYRDSVWRGAWLAMVVVVGVWLVAFGVEWASDSLLLERGHPNLHALFIGVIASTTIASKMLYDSVHDIIKHPQNIRYLVSRDTESLTSSEIHKAAIETYAENLSDGVVAPLFYLLLFGLPGAFAYKAINTLDSMVGYRNARYGRFGKVSARLDDIANYLPARITALLIVVVGAQSRKTTHRSVYPPSSSLALGSLIARQAARHPSPNAGYPIAAMGWTVCVRLGGPTRYDGVLKPKGWLGIGPRTIETKELRRAFALQGRLDMLIVSILLVGVWW
jgi:adenosylcobinamide-phosphate synthase